eukprot:TRINITY_DN960_c0_g1_i3.p2 TRINITY_DN960_c0_g1~~TRINITY_DN960_c0_g1_i3.p2  ORF type:complete len:332 (+),score=52.48 TRINITY_DN960_c0_g1_i3:65-1060(+)
MCIRDRALGYYQKLEGIKPNNQRVLINMAVCYEQINQVTEALKVYEKLHKTYNADKTIGVNYAILLFKQSKYTGARDVVQGLLKSFPGDPELLTNLNVILSKIEGSENQIMKNYEQIRRQHPEGIKSLYNYACFLAQNNKKEEALEAYQQVCEKCEDNSVKMMCLVSCGVIYEEMEQYGEALRKMEEALQYVENDLYKKDIVGKVNQLNEKVVRSQQNNKTQSNKNVQKQEQEISDQKEKLNNSAHTPEQSSVKGTNKEVNENNAEKQEQKEKNEQKDSKAKPQENVQSSQEIQQQAQTKEVPVTAEVKAKVSLQEKSYCLLYTSPSPRDS